MVSASMRSEVAAPISGRVGRVGRRVGDPVASGDEILVLESMKVEVPVEACCAGRIVELRVSEGESVAEGSVVAVIG
jgi:biotin carboxyl carrier protein